MNKAIKNAAFTIMTALVLLGTHGTHHGEHAHEYHELKHRPGIARKAKGTK